MGTPQYGGITVGRTSVNVPAWDPYLGNLTGAGQGAYMQTMFSGNYSTDPKIWDFSIGWTPPQYMANNMLTDWELSSSNTFTAHFRTDIYWQNIAPANGRQFTSADAVYHYDRMLGLGDGFTKVDPYFATVAYATGITSVTATDKFTVVFQWKTTVGPLQVLAAMMAGDQTNQFECPDAVALWGNLNDWHHAIGTGPWILTDFVDSSSETCVKNPNYWGHDLRFTQYQIPYFDKTTTLVIPNFATAEAALRSGKINSLGGYTGTAGQLEVQNIVKTNPGMVVKNIPLGNETTLDVRNDVKPFSDIRVRMAMQEAIDIPTIIKTFFSGGGYPWPASLTENQMGAGGWGYPYEQWPQDLKDKYAYNPTNAKALLAQAGYPNGFTTDLVLESDTNQDLFIIAQNYLAAIGITMSIQIMDPSSWQAFVSSGHKYDALAAKNQGSLGLNYDIFRQFQRFTTGYSTNYTMVNDPVINDFYAKALVATTMDQLSQLLHDENLYIAQQFISISLAQTDNYTLVQPWIGGDSGAQTPSSTTCWLKK